jgi:hypothetical protein
MARAATSALLHPRPAKNYYKLKVSLLHVGRTGAILGR